MKFLKLILASSLFLAALILAPRALAFYDLTVTGLSLSPAAPAKGQPVTITATVKNVGDDPSPAEALSSYIDNFESFTSEGRTLPAAVALAKDQSAVFRFTGYFSSVGLKRLYFMVNPDEPNFTNRESNYREAEVTVVKPYDLAVAGFKIHPTKPARDQICQVIVTVKNEGFASIRSNADGISSYDFDFGDFLLVRKSIPSVDSSHPLAAGQSLEYVFEGKFITDGKKTLSFTADKNGNLDEKDESNNLRSQEVSIASLADIDIKINAITVEPAKPLLSDTVTVKVELKNNGSVSLVTDAGLLWKDNVTLVPSIAKDFDVRFDDFQADTVVSSDYPTFTLPLDPGKTFVYTYTGKFKSAGTKELSAQANINSRLSEADAGNNSLARSVVVYADAAARDAFAIENVTVKPLSSTTVAISWQTTKEADSHLEYRLAGHTGYLSRTELKAKTAFSETLSGLRSGQKYEYYLVARNGTITKKTDPASFIVPADDTFAFVGAVSAAVSAGEVEFNFAVNLRASAIVSYRLKGGNSYIQVKSLSGFDDLSFSLSASDLPEGDYEYLVKATNAGGQTIESVLNNFSIGASGDQVSSASESAQPTADKPTLGMSISAQIGNQVLYQRLQGRIILTVEQNGEAYYIHPTRSERYYLGRPDDAFAIMREQGIGIKNADLAKIPVGLAPLTGPDSDGDGLSDLFEDAIGTDKNKPDTDGDGHTDKDEILAGYDPLGSGRLPYDTGFAKNHMGKIFLQVEKKGEAWYVSPQDGKRYFLGRPGDAFSVMRTLGLGIGNKDFSAL